MKIRIKVGENEVEWSCLFPMFYNWKQMGKNIEEVIKTLKDTEVSGSCGE